MFQKCVGYAVSLYMMSVMCMVPYFNWRFAKDNGFIAWLFLGEIVPTAKGLVWPFFVFKTSDVDRQRASVHTLENILTIRQKALELSAQWHDKPSIPQDVLGQMKDCSDEMLRESRTVDPMLLDGVYPQLGTMFSEKFVKSLALAVEMENDGIARRAKGEPPDTPEGRQKLKQATELEVEWAEWFTPRTHEIANAMKAKW